MGALVLKAVYSVLRSPQHDFQTTVLKNPEYFLTAINRVFLAINTCILIILGVTTFWLTKNIAISLIAQSSPFLSDITLFYGLLEVSPEPFILASTLLFALLIIAYPYKATIETSLFHNKIISADLLFVISFSFISGFGIASKLTFIPLLLIPLVVLPKFKNKILFIIGTILSFALCTYPIIHKIGWFFKAFVFPLLAHDGLYGAGEGDIVDVGAYMSNITYILSNNVFFSILLTSSLCILMISFGVPRLRRVSIGNINFTSLFAVSLSQLLGLVITAKHYFHIGSYSPLDRYFLPSVGLSGVSLILMIFCLKEVGNELKDDATIPSLFHKMGHFMTTRYVNGFMFILIISLLISGVSWLRTTSNNSKFIRDAILEVYHKVEHDYQDYAKIYYSKSSSPEASLYFSHFYDKYNSEVLQKLYENAYYYHFIKGKLYHWKSDIPFEEIVSAYGNKIIFQGSPLSSGDLIIDALGITPKKHDLILNVVYEGTIENIYEVDIHSHLKNETEHSSEGS
ncbi:hypothetical protein ACFL27_00040 [candidate division CSSED10-310 bacterium]|uniref:Glycosyltransferase RgtA/B/C/D-like domain-containing protein n=1 Tax=candidate division CSSED10-310 bacterium TaxID=2855610 RepID=A0ABV6YR38_UNCC1